MGDARPKDVLGLLVPTLFFISAVGRQVKVRRYGGARCNGLPSKADDQRGVNLREQTPDICISASLGRGVRSLRGNSENRAREAAQGEMEMTASTQRAVLAGGCFWGVQDLLRRYAGVISTRVGYTGGEVPNATYRNHGNHAEAIEIIFDPDIISYRKLLEFFFQIHDPSTLNRQGNDRGASYRSAIFYTNDEQKRIAEDTIADVDASGLWPGKVVTEVAPAGPFWEAEPEHQDYLEKYPDGYTCHFIRPDWKLPQRQDKAEQGRRGATAA
jgi:peptide-methionine (S)-S-oxide reductase